MTYIYCPIYECRKHIKVCMVCDKKRVGCGYWWYVFDLVL